MLKTPFLDDHHLHLADQVDRFVREQVRGAELGETEDEQARYLVRSLARETLLVHTVPEETEVAAHSLHSCCVTAKKLEQVPTLPQKLQIN